MSVIEEQMRKLHAMNDGAPDDAQTPTPAVPETPAVPAAPVAPATLSFDSILPDDDDLIPPTLRGKTLRELAEDRRRSIQQRDAIGEEKNTAVQEALLLKRLLGSVLERQPAAPTAPAPTPETYEEQIRRESLGEVAAADPNLALGRVADIAEGRIVPQIDEKLQPIDQRLSRLEKLELNNNIRAAHRQAGVLLGREAKDWASDREIEIISSVVESKGWAPDDPQSYVEAAKWIDDIVSYKAPKPTAAAPRQPSPTAPAPTVGSGAPAAPVDTPVTPEFDVRTQNVVDRVAKHFRSQGYKLPDDKLNAAASAAMSQTKRRRTA